MQQHIDKQMPVTMYACKELSRVNIINSWSYFICFIVRVSRPIVSPIVCAKMFSSLPQSLCATSINYRGRQSYEVRRNAIFKPAREL